MSDQRSALSIQMILAGKVAVAAEKGGDFTTSSNSDVQDTARCPNHREARHSRALVKDCEGRSQALGSPAHSSPGSKRSLLSRCSAIGSSNPCSEPLITGLGSPACQ